MVIFHSYVKLPEGMHWWKQHQPLLWYIMIHRPRPSLSIKNRSNLRLVRQRGPKARALLQMIAGPGKFQRIGIEKNQAAGIHQRCRHGILMFFANYERWWPRPSEMFFFLIHVCYIWWHRYIHICVHTDIYIYTPNSYTNKMNRMNQLSGSELCGIVCKTKSMLHPNVPC